MKLASLPNGSRDGCLVIVNDDLTRYKFEDILAQNPPKNFCFGNNAGIVECCLIPQLENAHRWGVSLESMPNIQTLEERCSTLTAFINAHPDKA